MNVKKLNILFIAMLSLLITSCEAIGDIFSAGFYVGMAAIVAVIVIIVVVVSKLGRRG